ncbi:uncharacterized protein LOC126564246 [Anopheles maculipalpis]|uniref:uncharacterized protein LOC126564246 n=1 Tax=Anopheles maculipalpis TaxID=1496333 RepID=UPI0021593A79|nr:uncharacterized protein LOC126564246 [Anopheles maculipalpis]
MDRLSKIIVKKYFPSFENFQPRDRVTNDEYRIVKRCTLDDLLETESNPAGLEQICEGEKMQTAEYYKQKKKNFERNLAKFHRKPAPIPRQRRVVRTGVPTTHANLTDANGNPSVAAQDNQLASHDNQPTTQFIVAEELQEPTRSNDAYKPQHDPYQLPEEMAPLPSIQPSALLPEDDNFGSQDVDGARDFLQLCTGEELPPMSLRESMTREMLMAQFPSLPKIAPMVDNFQELDLRGINTPLFKRPLQTSTPLVASVEQVAQLPLPALEELIPEQELVDEQVIPNATVETVPTATAPVSTSTAPVLTSIAPVSTSAAPIPISAASVPTSAASIPTGESSEQRNAEVAQLLLSTSSSTNHSEVFAPQPRRIQREVSFTRQLVPYPSTAPMPRERRNFDIFSFRCPTIWNKTIQDVQTQLEARLKQQLREVPTTREALTDKRMDSGFQQLREVPILREALTDQRVDSGFQQTTVDDVPKGNLTEPSNLQIDAEVPGKLDPTLTSDIIATMQPISLDQPGSIDVQLVEVSDRVQLKLASTASSFSQEKTTVEKRLPVVQHVPLLQESAANTVMQPVIVTESNHHKKGQQKRQNKKTMQNEIDPISDISSVLFNQAKELDPIPEDDDFVPDIAPLDATIVDILNVVQGEMSNTKIDSVPVERLEQLLRIDSALAAAKMFKNFILLRMAGLLEIETNAQLRIANVSIKLPQVDDLDIL